jgi:ATPase subunit of ABC transporter with duplicated ATPase domains
LTTEEYEKRRDKLEQAIEVARQKAYAAEAQSKALEKRIKSLSRTQRTHRLCEQGALLGVRLIEPDLLSPEQVIAILDLAFSHRDVQELLRKFLEQINSEPPCG